MAFAGSYLTVLDWLPYGTDAESVLDTNIPYNWRLSDIWNFIVDSRWRVQALERLYQIELRMPMAQVR